MAGITLTSGLKNIGDSLVWFFDEWDAGNEYWGQQILIGINEGGVGLVTDKNYDKISPDSVKETVDGAVAAVTNGEVEVPSAIGDTTNAVVELRESVRP